MEMFDEFSICKPWELDKDKFYVDATPEEIRHLIACAQAEHPDHIPDTSKMVEQHNKDIMQKKKYITKNYKLMFNKMYKRKHKHNWIMSRWNIKKKCYDHPNGDLCEIREIVCIECNETKIIY